MSSDSSHVGEVYSHRFTEVDADLKNAVWKEICRYLQRFVPRDSVVLDVACDRGYFIRNIEARERWASDLRDVSQFLPDPIRFVQSDGIAISQVLPTGHFDVVFMSNYLEHLPSGDHVVEQLRSAFHVLRPGGRVVVLQPNIRFAREKYWDFIDHKVALTHHSLVEAAEIAGFTTERLIERFLPYTTKGRLPVSARLTHLYLRVPAIWRILGAQTLYIGRSGT